jgi:hypothetical protein
VKLTWFGGTALRAYVGGDIVLVDPDAAPDGVDRGELLAGADRVVRFGDGAIPAVDPVAWRQRPAGRAIDAAPPLEVRRLGERALLVSAAGEPSLALVGDGDLPRPGRWADGAVIVLLSAREELVAALAALLDVVRPRVIALALDEQALARVMTELARHLDGTGLVSMEPGLALEV